MFIYLCNWHIYTLEQNETNHHQRAYYASERDCRPPPPQQVHLQTNSVRADASRLAALF